MYRLEDAASPVFARHETFHPRYGWFGKGVRAAQQAPNVFSRESATVDLGVGKNMVRAIRFWGKAAKVLADSPNPERPRLPHTFPSHNGLALLDNERGLDPFLELTGSLWLLHWWMLSPRCLLPVWWLAFNEFSPIEFTDEDLLNSVIDVLERAPTWGMPVTASIKKDVDCLLRMYAPPITGRVILDDILDCPFRELGLIEPVWGEKKRYRFVLGAKPTLPPAIVAYACLEYLVMTEPASRTVTIGRLTHGPGSPGRAFRLTEDSMIVALEEYSGSHPSVRIATPAGVPQLTVSDEPVQEASVALLAYYWQSGLTNRGEVTLGSAPAAMRPRALA